MALLAPRCRMAKILSVPAAASQADLKIVNEDTNKMSKSRKLIDITYASYTT